MRIHRVQITGFGPFRGTETVDFDAFVDDGIFLITGRTGAGKTSILDAVTFALFGSVPRYSGQPGEAVRSAYLDPDQPCSVELEFSTGDRRFKVTRAPAWERPKQRGSGTTLVPVKAELDELKDGNWERLQSKVGETSRQINDLIRMNSSQFQQVVLLAQGQFQEFLVAGTDKRRELLQTLFGTKRFADYVKSLSEQATELKRRLEDDDRRLHEKARYFAGTVQLGTTEPDELPADDELEQWCCERITEQADALTEANRRCRALLAELNTARRARAEAADLAGRQRLRTEALTEQADLAARATQMAAVKESLQAAQRADLVAAVIESFETAMAAVAGARRRCDEAAAGYLQISPQLPETIAELGESIAAMNQLLGRLQPQLEAEKTLPGLRRTAETAAGAMREHEEQTTALRARREADLAEASNLSDQITALESSEGLLVDAQLNAEETANRLAAARRAEELSAELQLAQEDEQKANRQAADAAERLAELRRRQLAGYAADLAQDLTDGRQCPVCGSLDHPHPAALTGDHVDQSDVDEAQSKVDATYARSRQAAARAQQLAGRRQTEFAAAAELSVAQATAAAGAAQELLDQAKAADARLRRCRAQLTKLQKQIDSTATELETAHGVHEQLAAAEAAARLRLAEVEKTIAEARGDQVSVQSRVTNARCRLDACRLLSDAWNARQAADERADAERARLQKALSQVGFLDIGEAKQAQISQSEQQRLRATIGDYETRVAAVELRLESSDLADLPAEPVDVDTPEQAVLTLDTAVQEARGAAAGIQPRLEQLQRLAGEIAEQLTILATTRQQFAAVDRLASTLRGLPPNTMRMELETFVLAAQLEEIVQVANVRLRSMTDGRFALRHSDAIEKNRGKWGLGLEVLDAHTGGARTPDSLSGGEKFQASLALALGLADVVTSRAGGMRLDTLFIDEGFGSLDEETLDTTMTTLDNLREGGRTVGLISHVASMKESIPAQLSVEVVPGGWSIIRQEAQS